MPAGVSAREIFHDPAEASLFPTEEAVLARAVDKRRREFTTARWCARRAMAALGVAAAPLVPGRGGAPTWPPGVVGSMTHCAGYRAAAVGLAADFTTIGIDAEPQGPLPAGVLDLVTVETERAHLARLAAEVPGPSWDRLLFSAKESVYKAWFPLTGRWLGFEEALLSIDPRRGTFTARLVAPGLASDGTPLEAFTGRWLSDRGFILTAIAVPARRGQLANFYFLLIPGTLTDTQPRENLNMSARKIRYRSKGYES